MIHSSILRSLIFCGLLWLPSLSFSQSNPTREIGPNEFILVDKEPVPLNLAEVNKMIGYPPEAVASKIEGNVIARILVDEKGNYMKHIIMIDPHPILTNAVESKISNLKFKPAMQFGNPIKLWHTIPFNFKFITAFSNLEEALAADPENVKELNLKGQNLQMFPMEVIKFTNLRRLELGNNQLTVIPSEISQLNQLSYLGLSRNQLTALPDAVLGMPSLEKIMVEGNLFPKSLQKSLAKSDGKILFPKDDNGKVQW